MIKIKEYAEAIVKECERVERIKKCLHELQKKTMNASGISQRSASAICIKLGTNYSDEVCITERDLPTESLERVRDCLVKELTTNLKQSQ